VWQSIQTGIGLAFKSRRRFVDRRVASSDFSSPFSRALTYLDDSFEVPPRERRRHSQIVQPRATPWGQESLYH